MSIVEKPTCPRCAARVVQPHCVKSKKCTWRICIQCSGSVSQILVFNTDNSNWFIAGRA